MTEVLIAGVDEAGRGPLAGPVAVAAVILSSDQDWSELDDSKRLSEKQRDRLSELIRKRSLCWHICLVDATEIDQLNILQATLTGMARCLAALSPQPTLALIDGNRVPPANMRARAIVGGDGLEPAISAASILAKTARDRYMVELGVQFPQYGFERHKGYPTPEHLESLARFGPTPEHRRSFGPVHACCQQDLFDEAPLS